MSLATTEASKQKQNWNERATENGEEAKIKGEQSTPGKTGFYTTREADEEYKFRGLQDKIEEQPDAQNEEPAGMDQKKKKRKKRKKNKNKAVDAQEPGEDQRNQEAAQQPDN